MHLHGAHSAVPTRGRRRLETRPRLETRRVGTAAASAVRQMKLPRPPLPTLPAAARPGGHAPSAPLPGCCSLTLELPDGTAMKLPRRTFLRLAAGAAALPAMPRRGWAQAYPARSITVIVPFAPGGGTDIAARVVGEHMSRTLG